MHGLGSEVGCCRGAPSFCFLCLLQNIAKLPKKARRAFWCQKIRHNLLAVSGLCDAGCVVLFWKDAVEVEHSGEVILRGWRDKRTKLWRVPIVPDKQELHFRRGMLGSSEGALDRKVGPGDDTAIYSRVDNIV